LILDRSSQSSSVTDLTVEAHRCRLAVWKSLGQAAELCSGSGEARVREILVEAQEIVKMSPAFLPGSPTRPMLETLLQDVKLCLDHVSDIKACEKWCSSKAFAHKHQVSTCAEVSTYRNALQERMVAAAKLELAGDRLPNPAVGVGAGRNKRRQLPAPESRTSAQSSTSGGEILAGGVRVGMAIICPRSGQAGTVQHVTASKTGKHGHAKVFLQVLCVDGVMRESAVPASHDIRVP